MPNKSKLYFIAKPGGGGGGNAKAYARSFVDADLVAGILTINHALGNALVDVTIRNNLGAKIMPDADTILNANNVDIGLASFQPLPGIWTALVVGL